MQMSEGEKEAGEKEQETFVPLLGGLTADKQWICAIFVPQC